MANTALTILEMRDTGGSLVTYFGIVPGREHEAGLQLLYYLSEGAELCLRNDLDEGHEGCTFFRHSLAGYSTMIGGHGWQGDWKATVEQRVLATVAELADLNRGEHWSTQGSIVRRKTGNA